MPESFSRVVPGMFPKPSQSNDTTACPRGRAAEGSWGHRGFGEVGLLGAEVVAGLLVGLLCSPLFSAIAQVRFSGRRMSTASPGHGLAARAGMGAAAQPAGRLPARRAPQGLHREGHRLPPPFQ